MPQTKKNKRTFNVLIPDATLQKKKNGKHFMPEKKLFHPSSYRQIQAPTLGAQYNENRLIWQQHF